MLIADDQTHASASNLSEKTLSFSNSFTTSAEPCANDRAMSRCQWFGFNSSTGFDKGMERMREWCIALTLWKYMIQTTPGYSNVHPSSFWAIQTFQIIATVSSFLSSHQPSQSSESRPPFVHKGVKFLAWNNASTRS